MKITLRQLEIFNAVAKHEHVTKAANEIYLSQSAVSMAINELEYLLHGKLFYRTGKKLILNDRGRLLQQKAITFLDMAQEIELSLSEDNDILSGILKVGASSTIGNYLLPKIIGNFLKEYPQIKINLEVANTEQIADSLIKNKIDIGFIEGNINHHELIVDTWFKDELVIFTNNIYKSSKNQTLKITDLSKLKWIGREKGSGTREIFEKEIKKYLADINYILELGNSEAIKNAVESGLGVSCLSRLTIEKELKQKEFIELEAPFLKLERELQILLLKKSYQSKLLKIFILYCSKSKSLKK